MQARTKLKILYVSPNGYLGGAEKFVLTACLAHQQRGNDEVAILFFSEGEAVDWARTNGITCFVLKQKFRLLNLWSLLKALREMRSIVKKHSPQILNLTMPYSHITLSLATLGMNLKKVWFQHGPVGGLLDRIANLFPVNMIWYNSEYLKQQHHQTWPRACIKNDEHIIHLGIELPAKTPKKALDKTVVFGMAGRICELKGFHHVIQALGELKKEIPVLKPFKLKIAGSAKSPSDQLYQSSILQLVKNQHLENEIEFLTHQKNMNEFYPQIDVLLHASIIPEAFGLVIAEAMSYGVLVLGPSEGGAGDILINEKTGLTFNATSDQAVMELKTRLKFLLQAGQNLDSDYFSNLRNNARNLIETQYSVKAMMDQIEKLYQ